MSLLIITLTYLWGMSSLLFAFYLNRLYLRISNSDNSYTKHSSTGRAHPQQAAFLWVAKACVTPDNLETPEHAGEPCFQFIVTPQDSPRFSAHQLQFTLPHFQISHRTHSIQHPQHLPRGGVGGGYKYHFIQHIQLK